MSGGRTVWRAKDAAWWRREWIVELGEEFGAAGPAVIDWLECEAKSQNDGGWVKAGLRTVARGCFVDAVTVGHVVSRSVTLGLLVDYEESAGRFTCRISWWRADQEKGLASERKAKQRAGHPIEPGDSQSLSRSVTECPPTGQDRTGQESSSPTAQKTAKRANGRVDQSKAPDDFPVDLVPAATDSLAILRRAWDVRGGVEPQPRGVALAVLRQPKADHRQVAQGLEHWLTAGKGQRSKCDDIARRFGDWVADAPAADRGGVVPLRRNEALRQADAYLDAPEYAKERGA